MIKTMIQEMTYDIAHRIRNTNKYLIFFTICAISFVLHFFQNELVLTDELFFSHFAEKLTYNKIIELIDTRRNWIWVSYSLAPFFFIVKTFLIATVIMIGIVLLDIKIEFKRIFQIVMMAEIVQFLPLLITVLWFGMVQTRYSFQDIQSFAPLSLYSLFAYDGIEAWKAYALKTVNLFELLYWATLALGLHIVIKRQYGKMFQLVAGTYGVSLFLWVLIVVYLIVTIS